MKAEVAPTPPTAQPPAGSAAARLTPRGARWLPALLLVVAWLYVCFWVEPPLRYYVSVPGFFLDEEFFAKHLRQPGGLLDYAAAWLAQFDGWAIAGALVTTSLAGLVAAGSALLLKRAGVHHPMVPLVPALLLLMLAGHYESPMTGTGLGMVLAVWSLVAWQRWRPGPTGPRWAFYSVVTAVLGYVAGPIPALLFAVSGSLSELQTIPTPLVAVGGLGSLLTAAGVWVLADLCLVDPLRSWGSGITLITCLGLHLFLPTALGFACLGSRTIPIAEVKPPVSASGRVSPPRSVSETPALDRKLGLAAMALAIMLLLLSVDPTRKALAGIEWEAQQGHWERSLAIARRCRASYGPATRLAIQEALYHTGRLTGEWFTFAQRKGDDLLPSLQDGLRVCPPLTDTLLELGQVNLAEHFAHEALETLGERPHLLWQLARINVLQNRPRAARVFLNRLRQIPFHRERADRRLRALEQDPTLASEADIARVRPLQVTTDYAESGIPTEILLRQLLQSNRRNRMAYEYLLAFYLLSDQPEAVVAHLGALGEFGSWETPRHLEEAMMVQLTAKRDATLEIAGRRVSPETARRHQAFLARLSQNGGHPAGIEHELARDYGNTFWFYRLFGVTFGATPPVFTTVTRP